MSSLHRRVKSARTHLDVDWDQAHVSLLLVNAKRRRQRQRWLRTAGGAAVTAALLAAVVWLGVGGEPTLEQSRGRAPVASAVEPPPAEPVHADIRFKDGSWARPMGRESTVLVREVSSASTVLELTRGKVLLDVEPDPGRAFIVIAGPVRVEVIGTRFSVAWQGPRVAVRVEEGRVRVAWTGGSTHLSADEDGIFPPDGVRTTPIDDPSPSAPASASRSGPDTVGRVRRVGRPGRREGGPRPRRRSDPRTDRAEVGETQSASSTTSADLEPADKDPVHVFLEASDASRRASKPRQALLQLEAIWVLHPDDERAPLAAITAGRLHMALEQFEEAAAAFHRARILDLEGALAEEAWVREIEAFVRAGRMRDAQRVARGYLEVHPRGRHSPRVEAILE